MNCFSPLCPIFDPLIILQTFLLLHFSQLGTESAFCHEFSLKPAPKCLIKANSDGSEIIVGLDGVGLYVIENVENGSVKFSDISVDIDFKEIEVFNENIFVLTYEGNIQIYSM